jgi:NADH:ubiquinone oxidoreductase subunit H
MRWAEVGIVLLRVVLVFVLLMGATLINVWAERKILADMQSRIGPSRAGPWGILQTVADGLKLFFKESVIPRKVELGSYLLAPFLAVIPAFLIFMMVPFGAPFTIGGEEVILQGADLNIGLLFILAMSSMAVYAVVLAGWSSGSKYPLIGGVRATAQAISYEAAMGLAMVAIVMFTATQGDGGTLSLAEIVARQDGTWAGFIPRWNVFPQIVAFVIFMIAIVDALRHVLPGRIREHLLDVGHRRNSLPGRMERPDLARDGAGGGLGDTPNDLVPPQDLSHRLRLLLVAGHPPPAPIRPTDVARVEASHPRGPGLDHRLQHRHRGSPVRSPVGLSSWV